VLVGGQKRCGVIFRRRRHRGGASFAPFAATAAAATAAAATAAAAE
jgi:hypothetical protein